MKTFRRILVGVSLMVVASVVASADPLTATVTCTSAEGNTELSSTNNGTILCGGAGVFNLPGGDSLTSIVITLSGGVDSAGSSISLTNTTAGTQTGHGTTDVGYNLDALTTLPGFSFPTTSSDAVLADPFIFDVLAGTGNQVLQPNVPFTTPVGGNASGTLTNTGNFAPYEGTSFSIIVDTETDWAAVSVVAADRLLSLPKRPSQPRSSTLTPQRALLNRRPCS